MSLRKSERPSHFFEQIDVPTLADKVEQLSCFISTDDRNHASALLSGCHFGTYAISRARYSEASYRLSLRVRPTPGQQEHVLHHSILIEGNTISLLDTTQAQRESFASFNDFYAWFSKQAHLTQGHTVVPLDYSESKPSWTIEDVAMRIFSQPLSHADLIGGVNRTHDKLDGAAPGTCLIRPSSSEPAAIVFAFVNQQYKTIQIRMVLCPTVGRVLNLGGSHIGSIPYIGTPPEQFKPLANYRDMIEQPQRSTTYLVNTQDCISLDLFVNPVKIEGCGHVFDEDELKRHFEAQAQVRTTQNCPCCRHDDNLTIVTAQDDPSLEALKGECDKWRLANMDESKIKTEDLVSLIRAHTGDLILNYLGDDNALDNSSSYRY